jgi:hypothetical protein
VNDDRLGKSLSTSWHHVSLEFYNSTIAGIGLSSGGSGVLTLREILHTHPIRRAQREQGPSRARTTRRILVVDMERSYGF